jgi:hypothetical protein
MKIRSVRFNNKRKDFQAAVSGKKYAFPYVKASPSPKSDDPVTRVYVDRELGGEGFSYELQSGKTGTVHVEQVLEYNRDPNYLRDLMLYKLTLEAQTRDCRWPAFQARDRSEAWYFRDSTLSAAGSNQLQEVARSARVFAATP